MVRTPKAELRKPNLRADRQAELRRMNLGAEFQRPNSVSAEPQCTPEEPEDTHEFFKKFVCILNIPTSNIVPLSSVGNGYLGIETLNTQVSIS